MVIISLDCANYSICPYVAAVERSHFVQAIGLYLNLLGSPQGVSKELDEDQGSEASPSA